MEVLRLKIYQPHAHYRIPFTLARRHTYPIPPYSTVIGFICNILGIRDQNDPKFQELKSNLYLAIYGKFESMTREYIWFRNLDAESHETRFGSVINRVADQMPEHPGGQIPIRIDVLEDIHLIIYIYHSDKSFLESLKNAFENPEKRIYPLHLGRAEDWIVFDGNINEAIRIIEVDKNNKQPFYGKFNYYTWIPDPEKVSAKGEKFVSQDLYDEAFLYLFRKIKGSSHLIPSFYVIRNGFRVFEYIPVKLFEQGDFPFYHGRPIKFIIDPDLNIPLIFCKMVYPGD